MTAPVDEQVQAVAREIANEVRDQWRGSVKDMATDILPILVRFREEQERQGTVSKAAARECLNRRDDRITVLEAAFAAERDRKCPHCGRAK